MRVIFRFWNFQFWDQKWLEVLILLGFDDMGTISGWRWWKVGFCLIYKGFADFWWVEFLSWCWDEAAMRFDRNKDCRFGFCHPLPLKSHGISTFFRRDQRRVKQQIKLEKKNSCSGSVFPGDKVLSWFLKNIVDNHSITWYCNYINNKPTRKC